MLQLRKIFYVRITAIFVSTAQLGNKFTDRESASHMNPYYEIRTSLSSYTCRVLLYKIRINKKQVQGRGVLGGGVKVFFMVLCFLLYLDPDSCLTKYQLKYHYEQM